MAHFYVSLPANRAGIHSIFSQSAGHFRLLLLSLLLLSTQLAEAQKKKDLTHFQCEVINLSPELRKSLDAEAAYALRVKRMTLGVFSSITYVAIRPHIIRRSNGTGGYAMANLNNVIALTNKYYLQNGNGIQFYLSGTTPDYINNDALYNQYRQNTDDATVAPYDVTNALNQYYVQAFDNAGLGGYAQFPANNVASTRTIILDEKDDIDMGNRLVPHELGHTFNLLHTHEPYYGYELVTRGAGANCTNAGDLVCDTPADPYGRYSGATSSCISGCPPTYTCSFNDTQGNAYAPSSTNLMSYYYPCTHDFTAGQYDRMQAALALRQTHTAYTLNAPPTAMAAPSNVVAMVTTNGSVQITWQDNSSNEMGYFIERSTSPTTGFVPIGGIAPNETTFIDAQIAGLTKYYYRIRPSNTTTGSVSPTASVTTPGCHPSYSSSCNSGDAIDSFTLNDASLSQNSGCSIGSYTSFTAVNTTLTAGQTYAFSGTFSSTTEQEGITIWADLNRNGVYEANQNERLYQASEFVKGQFSGSFTLPANVMSGELPIRVIGAYEAIPTDACGNYSYGETEDYVVMVSTIPSCLAPTSPSTLNITPTSARLDWYGSGSGITFEARWRQLGTTTWNTLPVQSSDSYDLYNLSLGISYEWQVRKICAGGSTSTFTNLISFTTGCSTPSSLNTYSISSTAAELGWTSGIGQYVVQYRAQNAVNWNTISGITSTYYSLTGLTNNTAYEWKIQGVCSNTLNSSFSAPASFTTQCSVVSYASAYNSSSTSAYLSWSGFGPTTQYTLRWRNVGGANWNTISGLTSSYYSLTGLTNNTTYEFQVQTVCSDGITTAFNTSTTFVTNCSQPLYLYADNYPTGTTESISWSGAAEGRTNYTIRYRSVGSATWTSISSVTATYFSLTGLTPSTSYEWQVQTVCSDGISTAFAAGPNFTTATCVKPNYLYTSSVTGTTVSLNWYRSEPVTNYEIRYRVANTTPWTSVTGITGSSGYGYTTYSLTSLSGNTTFEWQVRTACTASTMSDWASGSMFTTGATCNQPTGVSSLSIVSTTAQLRWTSGGDALDYTITYKPVNGTATSSISGITSAAYSLTGLQPNTAYQWSVNQRCTNGLTSDNVSTTFTTTSNACATFQPDVAQTSGVSSYSAQLVSGVTGYTGQPAVIGTEIQWHEQGATAWTSIILSNVFVSQPLTGLTPGTAYEWRVRTRCQSGDVSEWRGPVSFTTVSFGCRPTYSTGCGSGDAIRGVAINNSILSQNTGCTTGGYRHFGPVSATLTPGLTTPFSLTLDTDNEGITIWADVNRDGFFTADERVYQTTALVRGSLTATFSIPYSTTAGSMTLRIMDVYNNVAPNDPCGAYSYGETEDYMLSVGGTPVCSAPINLTVTNISSNQARLNWAGSPGTSYTLQYRQQGSGTLTTVTSVTGSSYTLTGLTNNTTYEWQLRTACTPTVNSTYTAGPAFSTQCPAPTNMSSSSNGPVTATVYWTSSGEGSVEVQWRRQGDGSSSPSAWTTVSDLTTSFLSLTGLTPSTLYEWRIRTRCTDTESSTFSAPLSFSTIACLSITGYASPSALSAYLTWSGATGIIQYNVRWRELGSTFWNADIPITGTNGSSPSAVYSLTGLNPSTAYEWQVNQVCTPTVSSSYTAPPASFTTAAICVNPSSLFTSSITPVSANLTWYGPSAEQSYELRWRQQGNTDWNTVNKTGGSYSVYSLTALSPGTNYEWQVRANCTGAASSTFTSIQSFSTLGCNQPTSLVTTPGSTTARLNWYGTANVLYELQWRQQGSSTWTTVSDLSTDYYGTYILNGLTPGTAYEWSLRSICTPSSSSPFTSPVSFTTLACATPTSLSALNITSGTARLSWKDLGPAYELQWRPQGSTNWNAAITVASPPYTATGLSSSTTYEWQIRTVCTADVRSAYGSGTFTTAPCQAPVGTVRTSASAARFTWTPTGSSYEVQWRAMTDNNCYANTDDPWNTLPGTITATSASLPGLTAGVCYQWRVRAICGPGSYSPYSAKGYFSPICSLAPSQPVTVTTTGTTAQFGWDDFGSSTTYEVQWRVSNDTRLGMDGSCINTTTGALNPWNTISGVTGGTYTLTGLNISTCYQWRVRAQCENGQYTDIIVFRTSSTGPTCTNGMYTVKAGNWNDPTVWSCNRVPTAADPVQIGHGVTIPVSYTGYAKQIKYVVGGRIIWISSGRILLGP